MAEHTVESKTPALHVPKVDVLFRVKRGGHAFGRLRASKGGVASCGAAEPSQDPEANASVQGRDGVSRRFADRSNTWSGVTRPM